MIHLTDFTSRQALLFVLYSAMCVGSLAFTYFCVPETRGKSLEQIAAFFDSR